MALPSADARVRERERCRPTKAISYLSVHVAQPAFRAACLWHDCSRVVGQVFKIRAGVYLAPRGKGAFHFYLRGRVADVAASMLLGC